VRAAQIATLDGPSAISVADVPEPDADGKVLIDVHVAGVTFPEVLLSRGQYQIKPELPFVPGSEVAGTVRSAPEGSGVQPGQRVAASPASAGSPRWPRPTRASSSRCPTGWASSRARRCR
jgi:NADPH2:quinone reductase